MSKKFIMNMSGELKEALREYSKEINLPMSKIGRFAIEIFLEKKGKRLYRKRVK